MVWLVLTIVLGLIGIGAAVWGFSTVEGRVTAWIVAGLCGFAWVVMTFFLSLHTVGQREVGIVYNFSGTITGKKDPGVVYTAPWQHLKTENVGIQSEEFDLDAGNAAVSEDQQPIYARVFVNFQVQPSDVVGLYKRVGPQWKHILLDARVLQDVKEVTATYQTPEITTHREDLRSTIRSRLEHELARYDVKIIDVFLKNIGFSESYTKAVEQKQVQVQQALQAQAKVAQSRAEADQRIAEAKGIATANLLKTRHLTPLLVQQNAIDKLAPDVQVIYCTGRSCPAFVPNAIGK